MFTSLSVTSVLILIQGRTLVESSSQGSEGGKMKIFLTSFSKERPLGSSL